MQSGLNRLAAGARQSSAYRRCGRLCVVLLGLMVSGCAGIGQLGSLTDGPAVSVAFESIDGPPPAVHEKFMRALKDEAGARQITVVASSEANYRLRGYLAANPGAGATSVSWAWDVYDSSQRRALRLKGEDTASGGTGWANVDDQVLRRIARSGLDQLAGFAAAPRQQTAAAEPAPAQPEKPASNVAWLDDWAPEAAGIFRIFRRDEPKADVASAPAPARSAAVAPRSRASPEETPAKALSFAPEGR